jgi:hypothetical protein
MTDPVPQDRLPPVPTSLTRWRATALSFGPAGTIMLSFGLVRAAVAVAMLRGPAVLLAIPMGLRPFWGSRYEDG